MGSTVLSGRGAGSNPLSSRIFMCLFKNAIIYGREINSIITLLAYLLKLAYIRVAVVG